MTGAIGMDDDFLPPLSTVIDGITLRSWQPGDGAALAAEATASYEHLAPWMPWAEPENTPDASEVLVRRFAGQYLTREDFVLSIWDGDTLVGGTGFHPRWGGIESGIAEIGMWIAASRAGQGFGTRVLRALVGWGFSDDWGWNRLVWRCDPDNIASVRVAEKAGFQLEGTMRQGPDITRARGRTAIYGLLPEDPAAAPTWDPTDA
jgi:RimJ/RimL family protein N-acetyltransferase